MEKLLLVCLVNLIKVREDAKKTPKTKNNNTRNKQVSDTKNDEVTTSSLDGLCGLESVAPPKLTNSKKKSATDITAFGDDNNNVNFLYILFVF